MKLPIKKASIALLFFYFALLSLSFPSTQRQEKTQELRYEVTVTLKLIQVYVTDKKGNPVMDLGKNDFVIYDNGKKQSITEFERHLLHRPPSETTVQPETIKESPLPAPRELMSRKFFLLFDFAFNNAKGILKAKEAALHFLDTQLQPQDELGLLSYSALKSLTLHEYLTFDHGKVRKIVESFGLRDIAGRAENLEEEYWRDISGVNPLDASKRGGVFDKEKETWQLPKIYEDFYPETKKFFQLTGTRIHVSNFIQKIEELANALGYIPGYKHIILFSSGLPYSLMYGIQSPFGRIKFEGSFGDSFLRERYESLLKGLAASNSTFYALDTEDSAIKIAGDVRVRGAFSLQKMANATGGKYFGNINNYEKDLEKIQNLTGFYYVLGYYIDERWDGEYHEIKVKVNRPGCEVHAQKGYFNPKPFNEYSKLEKTLHLVDLALSENPLFQTPVRFPLVVLPCVIKGKPNLALFSKIPMEKTQELSEKDVELVNAIFDKEGNIVKIAREKVDFSKLPGGNIYHSALLPLDPGEYKCRLVIRNLETGRGAVASSSVEVLKSPDYGIQLYSPLLLKPEKDAFYLKEPFIAYSFDSSQYSPLVEELTQGTNRISAVVRCSFSGIQQPDINLSANLIHHLADTEKTIPATISILNKYQEEDTEVFLIELKTEELQSGEYSLYLFAEDSLTQSGSIVNTTFKVK